MQTLTRLFIIIGIGLLPQFILTAQNNGEKLPNTNEKPDNTVIINGQNAESKTDETINMQNTSKFDYGSQDILIPDGEGIDRMEDQPVGNFSKKKIG